MELADDLNPDNEDPAHYLPATLGNIMEARKRLPAPEVKRIAVELLQGLQTLHPNHLIHRDIKPENILIVNGKAKLSDIGLVRDFDHSFSLGGTLGFIPPERLRSSDGCQSQEDDLYVAGKVIYCLLTGYPPEKYPQIPPELIRDPDVRDLNRIITAACSRNVHCRFRSAAEFIQAFSGGSVSPRQKMWNWGLRAGYAAAGAAVLAPALLAADKLPEWKETYDDFQQAQKLAAEQLQTENRRFANSLLGGKPVTPVPGKFREALAGHLADFPVPVVIGGYYKFNKWFTSDGTFVGNKKDIPQAGKIFSQSPYSHLLAIHKKSLCRTQTSQYFLLEIP